MRDENPPLSGKTAPMDRWATRRERARTLLREQGFTGLAASVRKAGIRGSLAFVHRHLRYSLCIFLGKRWDRTHGVDTGGQIEVENLDVVGPNSKAGYPAVSTSPANFAFLSRHFPDSLSDYTYVDLGCGKGRTLLLASRMGFGRVIGVEFAESLCVIARRNISQFSAPRDIQKRCSVIHADATQYELPDDKLVLYFGNPFGLELWPAMLANIAVSLRRHPRPIRLVLAGSLEDTIRETGQMIADSGIFARLRQGTTPFFLDTYRPYHYEVFEALSV